ncbi:hypothetical protein D3C84_1049590 [compost metagenome]
MGGEDSAQADAKHGTHHAPRQKCAGDRRPLLRREDAQHYGKTDAAIGRFANADEEARHEHLLIVGGESTYQRGHAPDSGHENKAADAPQAIGDY